MPRPRPRGSLPRRSRQPEALLDPVEALGQAVRVDLQVVQRAIRCRDQVGAAHRERVEAELGGHRVEQRLERVARVDGAVAAHRAARRRVGVDAVSRDSARRRRV